MKNRSSIFILFSLLFISLAYGCTPRVSPLWPDPVNITSTIDSMGVTELSGLHWNPYYQRLYAVGDNGSLFVLKFDTLKQNFTKIGQCPNIGGPEGITQVDYKANEFYTIDEKNYEIRRFVYDDKFSKVTLLHKWDLRAEPVAMPDTGNDGPEGIVFVPDSFLKAAGFVSTETFEPYTSKKGMGGLIFLAHQKKGFIWVLDVNPDKDDDVAFVGKYKTNRTESCDLAFDRSSGLLYILHNTDGNYLEVSDLSVEQHGDKGRLVTKDEYSIPNEEGNDNVEGFAMMPEFGGSKKISAWLCRDVSVDESVELQKNCLWWFSPFMPGHQLSVKK